jgi:hypothetical protein
MSGLQAGMPTPHVLTLHQDTMAQTADLSGHWRSAICVIMDDMRSTERLNHSAACRGADLPSSSGPSSNWRRPLLPMSWRCRV